MVEHADWQLIETAPCDGTPVLLFHPAWEMCEVGICYGEPWVWQQANGDLLETPTHWTALPEPPEVTVTGFSGQDGNPGQ
jgi:hypothetical protein